MSNIKKDLTGEKFNRLTVIGLDMERNEREKERYKNREVKNYKTFWKCTCECGNITSADTTSLKNGTKKSCGCLNLELISKRNKILKTKKNIIEIDNINNEARVYTEDKKKYFIIDIEDVDKIKDFYWSKSGRYWKANKRECTQEFFILHNLIMNNDDVGKIEIDHIDRNTNNNKKSNFRITNHRENCLNRGMLSNNTSGVKGVCYHKKCKLWMAYIKVEGKKIGLGYHKDFKDAVRARKEAEIKYGYYEYSCNKEAFDKILNEH